ncbi:MAG: hypothetical protein HDR51_07245 [Treponema sp.]|nr:hypothetical protein [Treponema sp.]
MNKTIFQKISIVAAVAIIITPLFSCHPDGPEDFIDYVYDAGNMGGVIKTQIQTIGHIQLLDHNDFGLGAEILMIRTS